MELVAAQGYTSIQMALLEQRYCILAGHKFSPFNVPTPDGKCPFCEDPAFREAMSREGMPEIIPDTAILASARAGSSSTPQALLVSPQTLLVSSSRTARIQRHRILRRSVAQRSVE